MPCPIAIFRPASPNSIRTRSKRRPRKRVAEDERHGIGAQAKRCGVGGRVRQSELSREAQSLFAMLTISDVPGGYRISLRDCLQAHLGLRLRQSEVLDSVRSAVGDKRAGWSEVDRAMTISTGEPPVPETLLRKIAKRLAKIASRPLTPKQLVNALEITTRERLRWTKDGRLRTSSKLLIRNGAVAFSVPTYPVPFVQRLVASPEIITAWRARDSLHDAQSE